MVTYSPTLLESRRPATSAGAVGGSGVSLVLHAALIAVAVYSTLYATKAVVSDRLIVPLPALEQEKPPPPAVPHLGPLPVGFRTLAIPTDILPEIPPPSREAFDASSFSGVGLAGGVAWGTDTTTQVAAVASRVYTPDMVEEVPARIAGAAPTYPALLRQSRIAGEVTVECIVDTAGHVEPGSIRIVHSTHPLFEAPVREAVSTWRFTPGLISGRPVRSLVRLPFNFVP